MEAVRIFVLENALHAHTHAYILWYAGLSASFWSKKSEKASEKSKVNEEKLIIYVS